MRPSFRRVIAAPSYTRHRLALRPSSTNSLHYLLDTPRPMHISLPVLRSASKPCQEICFSLRAVNHCGLPRTTAFQVPSYMQARVFPLPCGPANRDCDVSRPQHRCPTTPHAMLPLHEGNYYPKYEANLGFSEMLRSPMESLSSSSGSHWYIYVALASPVAWLSGITLKLALTAEQRRTASRRGT